MGEWIKAKLKTFDEIKEMSPSVVKEYNHFDIYHSSGLGSLSFSSNDIKIFGNVVDVDITRSTRLRDRTIYYIHRTEGQTKYVYKEWFEWIGEEPIHLKSLPESLWDISDW